MHLYMSLIFNQTPTSFPYPIPHSPAVADVKIGEHPDTTIATLPSIPCFCSAAAAGVYISMKIGHHPHTAIATLPSIPCLWSSLPSIFLPFTCSLNFGDKYTYTYGGQGWISTIESNRNVYPVRMFKLHHMYISQMYFPQYFSNVIGWSSFNYPKLNLEANIKSGLSAGQHPANWPW